MVEKFITEREFIQFILKREVEQSSSIKAFAAEVGVSDVLVHNVLKGRVTHVPPKLLEGMGYQRVVSIRKKR